MKTKELTLELGDAQKCSVIPASKLLSPTEQQNPRSLTLSSMSLTDAIHLMVQEEIRSLQQIESQSESMEKLITKAVESILSGGRVVYVGAGTSGRLAAIDAVECHSTFDSSSIISLLAGGDKAMSTSMDEAEETFASGVEDMKKKFLTQHDLRAERETQLRKWRRAEAAAWEAFRMPAVVATPPPDRGVIGISASGQTPFLWGGLSVARSVGAFVALITFNPFLEFKSLTPDLLISLYVGPEVLTGSTRLKCGTTTKCLLNMISTLTMVKLGKTYDNLMMSVVPGNSKLKERLVRAVCSLLTDVDEATAMQSLQNNGYDVRKAIQALVARA